MEALSDDANVILYNQTTRIVTDTYGGFKFGYRLKSQVILLFSLFLLLFRDDSGGVGPTNGIFVLAPPHMTEKLSHPIPVPWGPTPPRKTLFFVNLPYN